MALPSLTKIYHNKAYAAIDATRPELSVKGKTVVISGGGTGIGAAMTLGFAQAGAAKIAITSRRAGPLNETKQKVEAAVSGVKILAVPGCDISDLKVTKDTFDKIHAEFGHIDILIANAGYLSRLENIDVTDPDEWWTGYEINVRGTFNTARSFLPYANPAGALVVDVTTAVIHFPFGPSFSSYVPSKFAATKVWDGFAKEHPSIPVFHLHPGIVPTELNIKSGFPASDSADLAGNFVVWLISPEARFLRDKFVWANWDAPELLERKAELSQPDKLNIGP
ncbi:hypothetical protein PV10_05884 [Exophiala mesophila]|uniref:NAD(P)-binding protein n=1 Tax=Exophiala mesophila TaxID=212818 RepID=A0A0D1XT65_EXOME|nr:uncharacterized protein PV10_05884 [Exophiala mesophila]KIV91336.1 hypothetical protein PV10_05884 [Exophiala mesophila]